MSEIGLIKEAGAVFFTNGDRPVEDAGVLRRAMQYAGQLHRPRRLAARHACALRRTP
jgi:dihydroorotase